MKGKLKLALAAAAVASAFAGPAHALTVPGSSGSLFLAVWDSSAGATQSYVRDLGLTLNQFLPNGAVIQPADGGPGTGDKTPASGLSLTFATDPLFASTFAGVNSANLRWNVTAGDFTQAGNGSTNPQRLLTTQQVGVNITNVSNGAENNGLNRMVAPVMPAYNTAGCGPSCALNDPTNPGWAGGGNWGANFGGTTANINNAGIIGGLLEFWLLSQGAAVNTSLTTQTIKTVFANATGRADWSLLADGTLTYNLAGPSAVPIPAAVWLFGTGLLGMVGIGRRRQQKLAAA
jgi:hypothetical protein